MPREFYSATKTRCEIRSVAQRHSLYYLASVRIPGAIKDEITGGQAVAL